jgi:hypothetical protein
MGRGRADEGMYVSHTALAKRYNLGPDPQVKLAGIDPLTDALARS